MIRHIHYFTYLLVISASVCIPEAYTDTSVNLPLSDNAIDLLINKDFSLDSLNEATIQEACNASQPCQNAGTCDRGECRCPEAYTGPLCETPAWCTWGRCGHGSDVECVWDPSQKKGDCRCKKDGYHYLPKDSKCHECDCGGHGSCQVAGDVLACKCDEKYALKSAKCQPCDCGPKGERCSFNPRGEKVCQCAKDYAPKSARWSSHGTWCEICDCGERGRCGWEGEEKTCDCEAGFRSFEGKCRDCNCGQYGTCRLDEFGDKLCTCDYGYAQKDGHCLACDCNFVSRRSVGVNCTFADGLKQCICPKGYQVGSDYCEDINECYLSRPCPTDALCINKPGTFECRCRPGYRPAYSHFDAGLDGCEDIDECSDSPCTSPATRCVNSPGSFDCVCADGFYATAATHGSSYKPAHNACYEIETQWRAATIALGVILSVGIIGISCYIKKHTSSS